MIQFSLDVDPMGAPRMTRADSWRDRAVVIRYRGFKDRVRGQLPQGFALPRELTITFFFQMPASWSKKKQAELLGKPHDQTPDIDNAIKAFMDVFPEDKHVYSVTAEKYWSNYGSIELEFAEID